MADCCWIQWAQHSILAVGCGLRTILGLVVLESSMDNISGCNQSCGECFGYNSVRINLQRLGTNSC